MSGFKTVTMIVNWLLYCRLWKLKTVLQVDNNSCSARNRLSKVQLLPSDVLCVTWISYCSLTIPMHKDLL